MEKAFAAILILICLSSLAQENIAERLEGLGEYRRAAVEYLRIAHGDQTAEGSAKANLKAALCFEKAGEYSISKKIYEDLLDSTTPAEIRKAAYYRVGVSDYFLGNLELVVNRAKKASGSNELQNATQYLKGWAYFFARDYSSAADQFAILEPSSYDSSAMFMVSRCNDGLNLKSRSPFMAASMSAIVPGSGKAFYGRWGDALVNLLVVGGTLGGAAALWERDREFALTLGVIGAFFYGGNVYGSYVGAKWFNEQQHRELYRYARQNVNRRPEEILDH